MENTATVSPILSTMTTLPMDELIGAVTRDYLTQINPQNPPSPADIQYGILSDVDAALDLGNAMRAKNNQWPHLRRLTPAQIADVLLYLYPIANIAYCGINADPEYDVLAMYQETGKDQGTYSSDIKTLRNLIRQYCYNLADNGVSEVLKLLRDKAPRLVRNTDRNLVPVNNGIFDFDRKVLMPFDPNLVFVSKSKIDYVDAPPNPVIHNPDDGTDWDVESWMAELSDDPEVVALLWEILGAIIRPLVPWNKSAWFYSEKGNNDKGTLCELMEQLCGEDACVSIPLGDFGKEFRLEPLLHASAIITHENDVGTFIDKAANMKAVVTGDMISINRKYKMPVSFVFRGFMVQCVNEYPRVKDKSDSFFRRQLFVPFMKCFTGIERKYIKDDYLHRPEVLRYVLWRVLNMDYYKLSELDACRAALEEYKEYNDPIRQFCADVLPMARWDMLPFTLLYDAYQVWFRQNSPSGTIQSKRAFNRDLIEIMRGDDTWDCMDKVVKEDTNATHMSCHEPILKEFNLANWMNKDYVGGNPAAYNDRYTPAPGQYAQKSFRGVLVRKSVGIQDDATDDVSDPRDIQIGRRAYGSPPFPSRLQDVGWKPSCK